MEDEPRDLKQDEGEHSEPSSKNLAAGLDDVKFSDINTEDEEHHSEQGVHNEADSIDVDLSLANNEDD
ncbi:hypothetical protein KC318_g3836 [Hortaea werneckii]|nr:hypothetical protein KC334_g2155 [Hortaea werneckii]KAI7022953.1 hypothetical protein KC355_g1878 [Hortaea werneckii]KAI7670812.1 hypothetical protein KC318_g3836 [Hortaea werneckii]